MRYSIGQAKYNGIDMYDEYSLLNYSTPIAYWLSLMQYGFIYHTLLTNQVACYTLIQYVATM